MIEIDTWPDNTTKQWKVSHSHPHRNVNNCTPATTAAQLYSGTTHSNLETCLDDVRIWLRAHPGAGPLVVKLELKAGFATGQGMGPSQLDTLIAAHLGDMVFRPADLLPKPTGGSYATASDAARADNWPTRSELAGRVLLYAIPGSHTPHPDIELGRHLRDLAATGNIGRAQVFPPSMAPPLATRAPLTRTPPSAPGSSCSTATPPRTSTASTPPGTTQTTTCSP